MEANIRDRLADLRRARGLLALHNKDLANINEQIAAAEAAIGIAEDVEVAEQTQQREQSEAEYQAELGAKRAQLSALLADDLADVKEAEVAARALAAAISRRLKRNPELAKLTHEITRAPVPALLHFPELLGRMGGWVAAIIAGAVKPRGRIGALQWSHISLFPADQKSWHDEEAKAYAKNTNPLIEGK